MSVAGPVGRRVVITGVGPVSPVGVGVEEFWSRLSRGHSGIAGIRSFDASRHAVRIAGEVRDFEPHRWMDKAELARSDRVGQLAIAATALAVEDARFEPTSPESVATVIGSGVGGASTIERNVIANHKRGPGAVSPFFVPGAIANMPAGMVAIRFGFGGPSACPVSACSSSADAVGWGFRLVRDGYVDACLVGGAEACVTPTVVAGFSAMFALSRRNDDPQRASRPFDAGRDGFVLAEGAAMLVLETADAAEQRGAQPYAEVVGHGQSTDANHITAPAPEGQGLARAIAAALTEAGVEGAEVDYVNAHGTSTKRSDPAETNALKTAFGDGVGRVAVSSTKSMTGHLLGAAGALEVAACALALSRHKLPPTINYECADPACDLDYVPNKAREARPMVALSNSMGFGGHNSCIALRCA